MKNMFAEDVPQAERLRTLQDNADDVVTGKYDRPLTEEELHEKRSEFFTTSLDISGIKEEKKAFVAVKQAEIKVLEKESKRLSMEIRRKSVEETGNTYLIRNHDTGMMETYDNRGFLIDERRLKPTERQSTIQASVRAIANG